MTAGPTECGREQYEYDVALDDTDRRRIFWASVITLIALPSIVILSRRDDSTAPDVAVADLGSPLASGGDDTTAAGSGRSNLPLDAPGSETPPVFLGGPTGSPGASRAAVAATEGATEGRQTTATYRRDNIDVTTCVVDSISSGGRITVVNLANNRSIECTARLAPADARPGLVMHRDAFLQLADLTDAPIRVEIRT